MFIVATLSLVVSQIGLRDHAVATYFLLPTRTWELMLGGIVALLPAYSGPFADPVSWLGLAAIMAAALLFNESMPFPGFAALLPCMGAAAILYAARGTSCAQALSRQPLRIVGLISYSLYLWHWPIIVLLTLEFGDPLPGTIGALAIFLSFLAAVISWRFVERPFRHKSSPRFIWATGAVCVAAGLVMAGALMLSGGLPGRFDPKAIALVEKSIADRDAMRNAYGCATEVLAVNGLNVGPCPVGAPTGKHSVIVVSDSHGMALKPAIDAAFKALDVNGTIISNPGCPPVFGLGIVNYADCSASQSKIYSYVKRMKPDAVLLIASWYGVINFKNTVWRGNISNDQGSRLANIRSALTETVSGYRDLGIPTGIMLPTPGTRIHAAKAIARGAPVRIAYSHEEHRAGFAGFADAVWLAKPAVVGDLSEDLCKADCLALSDDGLPLYYDTNHVNYEGNRLVEPVIERTVGKLVVISQQFSP